MDGSVKKIAKQQHSGHFLWMYDAAGRARQQLGGSDKSMQRDELGNNGSMDASRSLGT